MASRTSAEEDEFTRLHELVVKRVDLVPRGANGRHFAIRKTGETMATPIDPQPGAEVTVDGDGNLVAPTVPTPAPAVPAPVQKMDLPGPAKAGLLKMLTAANEKIASLLAMVKDSTENPTAKVPPEITNAAKTLGASLASIGAEYPSPVAKEDEPAADDVKKMTLEDATPIQALEHIEKAGRTMKADRLKKFQDHLGGLQTILKELEADPATKAMLAALAPIAKSFDTTSETLAKVAKLLIEERNSDPVPVAAPAVEPAPAPVPAGQAQPSIEPIAKADELGWGDVCDQDLNAEEPSGDNQ
jgi:NADH dehydrogenase/NADH:ubiquinone oxidoreductase subunit G